MVKGGQNNLGEGDDEPNTIGERERQLCHKRSHDIIIVKGVKGVRMKGLAGV